MSINRYVNFLQYGDTVHTLIERRNYNGVFLPGFRKHNMKTELFDKLPQVGLHFIDHCVGNQAEHQMEITVKWYENVLGFHRYNFS